MSVFFPSSEYLHISSVGNIDSCRQAAISIRNYLDQCYESNKIEGWGVYVISSKEKAEDVIILKNYAKVTNGLYPFLYAYIQPFEQLDQDIISFMLQKGFVEFN